MGSGYEKRQEVTLPQAGGTLKFEFRVSSRVSSVESSLDFPVFDTDIVIFPDLFGPT